MDRWKFVNEKWIPRTVSRGEGYVLGIAASPSNLRPFGAPPSIGRREYSRKPLPLEGAAERSEAGLASFFGRRSGATVKRTLVQHAPLGKATDTREMLLKPAAPLFFDAACLNPEPINL